MSELSGFNEFVRVNVSRLASGQSLARTLTASATPDDPSANEIQRALGYFIEYLEEYKTLRFELKVVSEQDGGLWDRMYAEASRYAVWISQLYYSESEFGHGIIWDVKRTGIVPAFYYDEEWYFDWLPSWPTGQWEFDEEEPPFRVVWLLRADATTGIFSEIAELLVPWPYYEIPD